MAVSESDIARRARQTKDGRTWHDWYLQISSALKAEVGFREEGLLAERKHYGIDMVAGDRAKAARTDHTHSISVILMPLVYEAPPTPTIKRRFDTNDPASRVAATVMQRLAEYIIDTSDFDNAMRSARDDWIIAGRGSARVVVDRQTRVVGPKAAPQQEISAVDDLQPKETRTVIKVMHCPWQRVLYGPSNSWADMQWIAYEKSMTRDEVRKLFGDDIMMAMQYPNPGFKNSSLAEKSHFAQVRSAFEASTGELRDGTGAESISMDSQCTVFEIWDKSTNRIIYYSPNYTEGTLLTTEDMNYLDGFFDCAMPLMAISKSGTLMPRPYSVFYGRFLHEINKVTKKIESIISAVSVSGLIDASVTKDNSDALAAVMGGNKNQLFPVAGLRQFTQSSGSVSNNIEWLPIERISAALQALVQYRTHVEMDLIRESGVTDLMRGQSDHRETAQAQAQKASYSSVRLEDLQGKMGKFMRDTMRIALELAIEHHTIDEIAQIVNIDLPATEMELDDARAQHEQQTMLAQQQGMSAPKEPFHDWTSWEAVGHILRSDKMRNTTLSIETKTTALENKAKEQENRLSFLQATTNLIGQIMPLVNAGVVPPAVAQEMILFAARAFPNARSLEGALAEMSEGFEPRDNGPSDAVTIEEMRQQGANERAQMDNQVKLQIAAKQQEIEALKAIVNNKNDDVGSGKGKQSQLPASLAGLGG